MLCIRKCQKCGKYTLKETCEKCKIPTKKIKAYKFFINEKHIVYRLKEKGYI